MIEKVTGLVRIMDCLNNSQMDGKLEMDYIVLVSSASMDS